MKQPSRRKQINPQQIKKHSDITANAGHSVFVRGDREETPTGYRARGFQGKSFETYYEVMLPGTSTPTLTHEKKDRTLRILSGDGFVVTGHADEARVKRLMPGDEVVLERGTVYRITTTAKAPVEMFVCQNAKYELKLEVLDDNGATTEVPAEMLLQPSADARMAAAGRDFPNRRRGSKAQQQLAQQRSSSGQSIGASQLNVPVAAGPERAGTAAGVNAKPSFGNFDDAGAG